MRSSSRYRSTYSTIDHSKSSLRASSSPLSRPSIRSRVGAGPTQRSPSPGGRRASRSRRLTSFIARQPERSPGASLRISSSHWASSSPSWRLVPSSNGTNIPALAGTHRSPRSARLNSSITRGCKSPTRYAQGETLYPGQTASIVQAPPTRLRDSRTRTLRPALARYAAQVSPLCPAPTTITSQGRLASSLTGIGRPRTPSESADRADAVVVIVGVTLGRASGGQLTPG